MKRPRAVFGLGFLLWLIPFVVAFAIYPIRESNRPLFESIMPVVITTSVAFLAKMYLSRLSDGFLKAGAVAGVIWLLISIVLDLLLFTWGPMKMSFAAYMADIGLTYLVYPVVTTAMAWALGARRLAVGPRV